MPKELQFSDCVEGNGCHISGFTFVPDPMTDIVHAYVCDSEGCKSYVMLQHVQLQEVGHATCMQCLKSMVLVPGSLH